MTKRTGRPRRAKRVFTPEFKHEAVRLMRERRAAGVSLEQVGRELDVSPDLLRSWAQREEAPGDGAAVARRAAGEETPAEELRRLRREVAVLRQERDFLKKAAAFFAREPR